MFAILLIASLFGTTLHAMNVPINPGPPSPIILDVETLREKAHQHASLVIEKACDHLITVASKQRPKTTIGTPKIGLAIAKNKKKARKILIDLQKRHKNFLQQFNDLKSSECKQALLNAQGMEATALLELMAWHVADALNTNEHLVHEKQAILETATESKF